jgi:hypothetical protein
MGTLCEQYAALLCRQPRERVAHREVRDEALTGEPTGQPLSRESFNVQGADAVSVAEGNTDRRDTASACSTLRGLRPWHVGTLFARLHGNREVSCLAASVVV